MIYRKSQHPYSVGRNLLFAPDVAKGKDGRYYLYYSVRIGGLHYYISDRPDGSIRQAEATSCGLNGGPFAGIGKYPAYIACALMDKNDSKTAGRKKMTAPCITQEGEDRGVRSGPVCQ